MSWRWLTSRDTAAAAILLTFGGGVLLVGSHYEMGTLTDMGPGYFPFMLGIIIVLFGLALLAQSIMADPVPLGDWHARPLAAVTASILLFALLVGWLGLVAAALGLVGMSRLASSPYRPVEVAVLGAGLALISVAVFISLLTLPVRAW